MADSKRSDELLLAARGESQAAARARDFSSDQGAKPQAYWSISRIWQRRAGGKDPLSAWADFCHGLLERIKDHLPDLEALLEEASSHWGYEDPVYRFYHQSFKVYHLRSTTGRIVEVLAGLAAPASGLNPWFSGIVETGTGKAFTPEANQSWTTETRPVPEAFFHAKYCLEMVCKYGRSWIRLRTCCRAAGPRCCISTNALS